ncbi:MULTISPECIES: hypothetical protein [Olivibacter]|uniref:DUF1320 domain-containing protein n=1 Tax=Olivibacter jilunii TaxID=985016 RepID=A0ABW6AYC5_9SPHI
MFINRTDIMTLIYGEKIDAISRDDEKNLNDAITYGIEEVAGYMNRFDTATLFAAAHIIGGFDEVLNPEDFENELLDDEDEEPIITDNRDPLLKGLCVVCASWYFIGVANVGVDYAVIQDRYEKAIDTLTKIQAGKITPRNWPFKPADPVTGSNPAQTITYGSNPKRENHF